MSNTDRINAALRAVISAVLISIRAADPSPKVHWARQSGKVELIESMFISGHIQLSTLPHPSLLSR